MFRDNPKKILIQELRKSQQLFINLSQTLNESSSESKLIRKSIADIDKLIDFIIKVKNEELQQLLSKVSLPSSNQNITQMKRILEQFIDKNTIPSYQNNIDTTYLDAINIKNYFSIKSIELKDLGKKREIYFVGENGDGKTILLQAIVLALKEDNYPVLAYDYIDSTKDNMELFTKHTKSLFYGNNENVKNLFAYGINRNKVSDEYSDKSGCSGLFDTPNPNHTTLLRKPQLLLEQKSYIVKSFILKLKGIIGNKLEIIQTEEGIQFKEVDGDFIPFKMLSEGYKTTLIWLSDLLSRLIENQPKVMELKEFKAIVLIDEVDLYLHPKWKYDFMNKLRKIFPKIQFIMTTHSLVTILGASEDAVFYKIYKEEGETKISEQVDDISYYTSDILMSSPLFNLKTITTRGYKDKLSSDDYVYHRIHKKIKERIQNIGMVQDDEVDTWLEEEFNKEFGE